MKITMITRITLLLTVIIGCKSDSTNPVVPPSIKWAQTGGPPVDQVFSLGVMGTTLYAGTSDGIFKSLDNGTNWSEANLGIPYDSAYSSHTWIYALAVKDSSILFAGTRWGVMRSTNGGLSWTESDSGRIGWDHTVWCFAVSGTNLFAGGRGVFLSTDNGTSWINKSPDDVATRILSLAISGTDIFAASENGVFRSTNNGTSWEAADSGIVGVTVLSLTVSGTDIFAGTDIHGVFRSTNNGTSWSRSADSVLFSYTRSFAVRGTNLYAGTLGNGVYLSTDNGITWNATNSGLEPRGVLSLVVSGTNLFAGTQGNHGVWRHRL